MEDLFGSSHSNKINLNYEVFGANLLNYYHRPLDSIYQCGDIIVQPDEKNDFSFCDEDDDTETQYEESAKYLNKSTQTDYRESDAQTDPWDPPFKVKKIYKEPDILLLKDLTYGNGLPATMLEVEYIAKMCQYSNSIQKLEDVNKQEAIEDKKEILDDQIKNYWKYKVAADNEVLLKKLELRKLSLVDELNKASERKERILKNMWNRKKTEMNTQSLKLVRKLKTDKKNVENRFLNDKSSIGKSHLTKFTLETHSPSTAEEDEISEYPIDHVLNSYLSNPEGLSNVKSWLEKKQTVLKNKVPLSRVSRRSQREKLSEEAYQDMLRKKRTKLPPKVYHEDYEKEEVPLPEIKPEDATEFSSFEETKIDMVTVWQKILRGLAYQKQMLQLIEEHKDGLTTSLSKVFSEATIKN